MKNLLPMPDNWHPTGLSDRERRIMAGWDNGMSTQQIARAEKAKVGNIRRVINTYAEGDETRAFHAATAQASRELAAAISQKFTFNGALQ